MRSFLILVTLLGFIPVSWLHPFVGVIVWCWLSFMNPHQLVWGLATELRLNLVISLVTILGYVVSREPKSIALNSSNVLLFLFAILWIISTQMALAPYLSDELLSRHLKTFMLLFMIMALANNRIRLHALVIIIVISIGYFGVYGGLVGVLSGGASKFAGPPSSMIADNNHLALAIVVTLPLANYLRMYSAHKLVRVALLGSMGLGVLGVLVTYSRGGLLGLVAMGGLFWWKSKHKILSIVVIAAVGLPALQLMPKEWWSRMDTIDTAAEEDSSFQGRLHAWQTSFNIAVANPIFGGGFSASQAGSVYQTFKAWDDPTFARAAHSIYFQVLGDLGFVGLAVFLLIFFTAWRNSVAIIRVSRNLAGMGWAADLSRMLQVSMTGYLVSGAALSMAYYDMTLTLIVILANLRVLVDKEKKRVDQEIKGLRPLVGSYALSRN